MRERPSIKTEGGPVCRVTEKPSRRVNERVDSLVRRGLDSKVGRGLCLRKLSWRKKEKEKKGWGKKWQERKRRLCRLNR